MLQPLIEYSRRVITKSRGAEGEAGPRGRWKRNSLNFVTVRGEKSNNIILCRTYFEGHTREEEIPDTPAATAEP